MLLWTWCAHICLSLCFEFFWVYTQEWNCGCIWLTIWGTAILFSIVAAPFYLPTRSAWEFQFLLILIFMFLLSMYLFYPNEYAGEGNGTPLQYSCLETPRDRGAWWAAVYGVAQSRTPLKWLSSSSNEYEMVSHCILTCFLLMTGDVENLFMYLAVICPPLEKYLFKYFAHQCIGYFVGFFVVVEL